MRGAPAESDGVASGRFRFGIGPVIPSGYWLTEARRGSQATVVSKGHGGRSPARGLLQWLIGPLMLRQECSGCGAVARGDSDSARAVEERRLRAFRDVERKL